MLLGVLVTLGIVATGVAFGLTRSSGSPKTNPRPTPSTQPLTLVTYIPPLDSLMLSILGGQWRTVRGPLTTDCGTPKMGFLQDCAFASTDGTRYVDVRATAYDSINNARGMFDSGHPYDSPRLVSGVGDAGSAGLVSRPAPAGRHTLHGVSLEFLYHQTVFYVQYMGEGTSFDQALAKAKAISKQIIARLPVARRDCSFGGISCRPLQGG
jgi:hypothetical protein